MEKTVDFFFPFETTTFYILESCIGKIVFFCINVNVAVGRVPGNLDAYLWDYLEIKIL